MKQNRKSVTSTHRSQAILGIVLMVLIIGSVVILKGTQSRDVPSTPTPQDGIPQDPQILGEKYDIQVGLSEGSSGVPVIQTQPLTNGESLSSAQIEQILARLPALPAEGVEITDFNLPPQTFSPPRPGNILTEIFPPLDLESEPETVPSGPLHVQRFAPEGEIPIAPFISMTFDQPMVALGTLSDLSAGDVPVSIEPALPGTWRWLGAQTLTFEYDSELIDRLPKATEYRVTVPAGTKSITGGVLEETVSWTFSTPPPQVVTTYPDSTPQPVEPVFFIAFDQRIDQQLVLDTIQVFAGSSKVDLALASTADIEANETVSMLVKNAVDGRWLAFRATRPLPADTSVSVTIGSGTPSAEGPLLTTTAQSFGFTTYAPLRIEESGCSWYEDECPPLVSNFHVTFNNPIETSVFSESMVTIQPEIPGLSINVYGNTMQISGETKGQTTYKVKVSREIQDIFGQKLGADEQLTFKVGRADPLLLGSGTIFQTLDPAAPKPVFSVHAINYRKLNLKIYSVQPADWPKFKQVLIAWYQTNETPRFPGHLVEDKSLSLNLPADTLTPVDIDLSNYTDEGFGQFIVFIEPPAGLFEDDEDRYRRFSQTVMTWVQVTQIGLDAYTDHSEMVTWGTNLQDGSPLAGLSIQPDHGGAPVTTGDDGTVRFPIPSGATYLVARNGADEVILPQSSYSWGGDYGWVSNIPGDTLSWYVFDDRRMYRPGEEVHIKGWLRRIGGMQDGDVQLIGSGLTSVSYQIFDPQGNTLGEGQADVNGLGGFDFAFPIPKESNLGMAQLYLTAQGTLDGSYGGQYYHSFDIQEFRRPEFEVSARNETTGPYFAGNQATLAVEGKYYAGGGLPNADVNWQVTTSASQYAPPNWPDFTFGFWTPWWDLYSFESSYGYWPYPNGDETQTFTGRTDASGIHYLDLDFVAQGDPSNEPRPQSVVAQATVMDVNRQAWSSTTTLLVHPADVYIGLRSDRYFVERGTPIKVEYIVTDLDGNPVSEREVKITAARLEWKFVDGEWVEKQADVQACSAFSEEVPGSCIFETPMGGTYEIAATVTDELGRANQSSFTRWVSGSERPASNRIEQEKVTLIPDQESYAPGDTAEILVQSPFSPAEGLLTVTRSGILYTERFEIKDGSATLKIPIEEKYVPNLNIQVDIVGATPRTDNRGDVIADVPSRPAFATGQLNLSIPPAQRTLALEVKADETELEPGGETNLTVQVNDADGSPVADAELAVVVVDEAILALTNYQPGNPLDIFYPNRPSYLTSIYGRSSIVLTDTQQLTGEADSALAREAAGGAGYATEAPAAMEPMATLTADGLMDMPAAPDLDKSDGADQSIAVRTDFNPLATFAPTVRTGSNGEARLLIKLPDNLTRYRIMVIAVDSSGTQFGISESNITARLPLMVRPSAPRFLNFGDKFELPVVLQNQTDEPILVDVAVRASNLEIVDPGQRVTVPANDRVEVRFDSSTVMAGTTHIQIAGVSGNFADAATLELPVYTPATSEAFATYGVIDEGVVAQPIQYPSGVFPQYGGLEVSTSSTALQSLTDAVLYLTSYPYECSEQLASRVLAVASLRDVLSAFKAEGLPPPAELEAAVERDIARLQGMQNGDGGFPYWRRGFESVPFNTIHVTHALYRAGEKGFDVPEDMQQNALAYLNGIENHYPSWYSQQTRWTLSAYALYVRDLMGDRDSQKAVRLLNEAGLENLSMEAIGWLWPVIDDAEELDAIRLYVNNHVVETAGAANFTTYYDDQTYLLLSSDRRTDAILLDALITDNPQSDLVPKVVNGLLAHRTKGRWDNTQENVFVLLTLDRYFNTYESQTPDFVARFWLGNTYAGGNEFRGYTADQHETLIPMNYVLSETSAAGGIENLILSKDGPGRLYYRFGLQYAPTDLNLDPLDMGFVIQRSYEAVDDPDDVMQDEDGIWHIKAGARVKVRITMVADNRRYHVALVDPLPAGLEIVNPDLAVSGSIPQDPSNPDYRYGWWWWGPWYEHQNMRDDRAEAFTSLLWEGVYEYTYIARATTPGTFIVPPAKAEEMYSPENFGRSESDWVIVE